MEAHRGDRVIVETRHLGAAPRAGEVVEVIDPDQTLRLRVRWDDGHESLFCPGSDSHVEPATSKKR